VVATGEETGIHRQRILRALTYVRNTFKKMYQRSFQVLLKLIKPILEGSGRTKDTAQK